MQKYLLFLFAWFLLSFGTAQASEPRYLDVHLGLLEPIYHQVLQRDFLPSLQNSRILQKANVIPRLIEASNTEDLIRSAQDTSVIGVLWIGHPAVLFSQDAKKMQILDSHLQGADGRYLPQDIQSAFNPATQFFALVSCHLPDVTKRYFTGFGSDLLLPGMISMSAQDDQNPFYLLTQIYTGPSELLHKIEDKLPEYLNRHSAEQPPIDRSRVSIQVSYRDLLSTNFDYVVAVNNHVVGVLTHIAQGAQLGNIKKAAQRTFMVPGYFLNSGENEISIYPDDSKRVSLSYKHPIDDILVDSAIVTDGYTPTKLNETIVHIGDDDSAWDLETTLSSRANLTDFATAPVVPVYRTVFTR